MCRDRASQIDLDEGVAGFGPVRSPSCVPIAVDHGFAFHHSDEDHLMLTHRLEPDAFIPPFSTHYTGAGGVVLNEKQELLVVSERYRRSNTPSYKLPGGALQAGEHLHQCVVREVKEETGVDAEFVSLICFRHQHGYRYGKSDIYFVCRLRPLTQQVTIQAEEIAEALWMHIDEYLGAEGVSVFNKEIVRAALSSPGLTPSHIEGYTDPERHEVFMPRTDQT